MSAVLPPTTTEAERERIELDDTRDGILFRFWIKEAAYPGGHPAALAVALNKCITVEDYRVALTLHARKQGVNLP